MAASPPVTTPQAMADVKPVLSRQPSLCMKPALSPAAASPPATLQAPLSLTSKEWVIPPRPKPGRKPATDTPPTKRKAQNRAAQRAFRERRAARVGELEIQMKQLEDDHDQENEVLKETVIRMEKEIEQYRSDLVSWVDRCRRLESELSSIKSSQKSTTTSNHSSPGAAHDSAAIDQTVGCGNCTLDTRCQCIDDAFTAMGGEAATSIHQHEKRPHSPVQIYSEKRIKAEPKENLEIDFTEVYSAKPVPNLTRQNERSPTSAVADPCGFCSDGTPCICAEMAAEQEQADSVPLSLQRPIAIINPPRQLDQFTPPPSEGDVSMSIPVTAPPAGCAGGPGTCSQCRADPNSTLFCKSLAASRAQSGAGTPSGCCGGQSAGGSCCQSQTPSRTDAVPLPSRATRSRTAAHTRLPPKAGLTLTCADAYTTLSRHPAYERASGDIAQWLPKLHATEAGTNMNGRPALEIDAANVMAVLKDFDRRFGQNR